MLIKIVDFMWRQRTRIFIYTMLLTFIIYRFNDFRFLPHNSTLNPEFTTYVELFEGIMNLERIEIAYPHDKRIPIEFVDSMDDQTLGTTYYPLFGGPEIEINKKAWDKMDEYSRALLVIHELGHAACGVDKHINGEFPQFDCPVSTMNWRMPNTTCAHKYFLHYMISLGRACHLAALKELEP